MFKENKSKKNGKKIILIILVLIIAGAALFFVYRPYLFDKYGISQENKPVSFTINEDNKNDIPYCLYQEGIIKSVNLFKNYMADTYGSNFTYISGTYKLNANMSYKVLGEALQQPDIEQLKVTIPEGKNAFEIARIFEENGVCKADEFISALKDDYNYEFLNEIDNKELRPFVLEGYLFPATYEIEDGKTAHDIVDMLLSAMNLRINEEFINECNEKNISVDDILTMASIIEKESSGSPAEMSKVSAVFWNRLKYPNEQNTPTLGSDPTVHYADLLEELGYPQSIWKKYSTYSCIGLPTGPICSPSESAIKAALNPDEHKYFYFFTDKEENFYYFETYEKFLQGRKDIGV